ncbi:MAG: ribosome small subunit-dependent GTPase A [Bacteroidota bacterium]
MAFEQNGIVVRSTGSRSWVLNRSGDQIECVVRGKFRIAGLNTTNPVAVGDQVTFQKKGEEIGIITDISDRRNYILRKAIAQGRKVHILAANMDQAVLVFTYKEPQTSLGFADRFITTALAYHIPVVVIINKMDLLDTEEEQQEVASIISLYKNLGLGVLSLSALQVEFTEQVREIFQHKTSFLGGHSGAGKTSLLNLIDPSLDLKTREISTYSGKGKHTTTFAQMFPLTGGGFIIDSPGIKEFGLVNFQAKELAHFFPEMNARMADCRFTDCLHLKEPGCAVKNALADGEIAQSRYKSYLSMLTDIRENSPYNHS